MTSKTYTILSSLVQIAMLFILTLGQGIKMHDSLQGVSIMLFIFAIMYIAMNLWLSVDARDRDNTHASRWQVRVYVAHILAYVVVVTLILIYSHGKVGPMWDQYETLMFGCTILCLLISTIIIVLQGIKKENPVVRLFFAISFRFVPQMVMAYKVLQVGGSGISLAYIISFHVLKSFRIYGIWLLVRENNGESRKYHMSVLWSEIFNELSWCMVTLAWL